MCLSERNNTPHDLLGNSIIDPTDIGLEKCHDSCDYVDIDDLPDIKSFSDDLKVIQLNIRGLISKQNDLSKLITGCFKDQKVDIVLLCETWVTKETKKLINIPGCDYIGVERINKKGGGVGLLVAKELHYRELSEMNKITDSYEGCFLEISTKGRNVICGSIYQPPNTDIKSFQNSINNAWNEIKSGKHKNIVIGLDHNLDFLKSSIHFATNKFIESVLEHELVPCITRPTRVTKNSSTLIDNILISYNLYGKQRSCVMLSDISDHFPSLLIIGDIFAKKRAMKTMVSRQISDQRIRKLKQSLQKIDWSQLNRLSNTNEKYDLFIDELTTMVDSHLPEKEVTIPHKQYICEPWLSKSLIKCGKKQLKLFEKYMKGGNSDDHERYKQYRNTLQKIKRRAKREFYTNQCVKFRNDSKRLWKTIYNVTKGHNDKSTIINCIKIDNIQVTNSKQISNEFGKFFSTIGERVATKGGNSNINIHHYLNKIPLNNASVFLTPCTSMELSKHVDKLPNKLSSGYDDISNKLLKAIFPEISEPLLNIFNDSLAQGIFPDAMKHADVVPLYKSGSGYQTLGQFPYYPLFQNCWKK